MVECGNAEEDACGSGAAVVHTLAAVSLPVALLWLRYFMMLNLLDDVVDDAAPAPADAVAAAAGTDTIAAVGVVVSMAVLASL